MTRGTKPDRRRCARSARRDVQGARPVRRRFRRECDGSLALLATAAVFEKYNWNANALTHTAKLLAQWPDAVWIRADVELEEAWHRRKPAAAAAGPGGQTFALLIGISKYRKPEISLNSPMPMPTCSASFSSQRGGGVPPGNILLLTDEKQPPPRSATDFRIF